MSDVDTIVEARLRAIGQRYTVQRRALVEALRRAERPVTIPDLAREGMPQSSAYRNVAVLEQAGAIHRVVTGEEFVRFELAEDLTEHHHHLVCRSCGTVEDVTVPPALERSMARTAADVADDAGYADVVHRLDVIGLCRRCRRSRR